MSPTDGAADSDVTEPGARPEPEPEPQLSFLRRVPGNNPRLVSEARCLLCLGSGSDGWGLGWPIRGMDADRMTNERPGPGWQQAGPLQRYNQRRQH